MAAQRTLKIDLSARGIADVSLNRPDRGNAFHAGMLRELSDALAELQDNPKARIVVLRGEGKHFCAGADLRAAAEEGGIGQTLADVLAALGSLDKPTVAVARGACIGGGAALAASCDILLASEDAYFSIPEVRFGIAPTPIAACLIGGMGERSFARYAMTGERLVAQEALRIGLVHVVCASETLEEALAATLDALLHGAPGAIGELKAFLRTLATQPEKARAEVALDHAATLEMLEGIASFREKRKPAWYPVP